MARALLAVALLCALASPAVAARHRTVCVAVTIELIPSLVRAGDPAPLTSAFHGYALQLGEIRIEYEGPAYYRPDIRNGAVVCGQRRKIRVVGHDSWSLSRGRA
jgi:hypothetical protein